jgi:hypothetical protein
MLSGKSLIVIRAAPVLVTALGVQSTQFIDQVLYRYLFLGIERTFAEFAAPRFGFAHGIGATSREGSAQGSTTALGKTSSNFLKPHGALICAL